MLTRLLVALLLLAIALGGWQWQRARHLGQSLALEEQRLEAAQANRDRWHARAMDVLGQLGDERQRARQAEAAVVRLQQALEQREAGYRQARQRVQQAPPEADAPVAPVLRQALEALPHAD